MSSSWWAKKLGQPAAQPQSTPNTWNLPQVGAPTPAYAPAPPSQVPEYDAPVMDDNGQIHVSDAIMRWKGGEAAKTQHDTCPNCAMKGKKSYVHSRTHGQNENGQRMSLMKINQHGQACAPAPVCFACGWRGELYVPFGGED
jgi:hypothetical protein